MAGYVAEKGRVHQSSLRRETVGRLVLLSHLLEGRRGKTVADGALEWTNIGESEEEVEVQGVLLVVRRVEEGVRIYGCLYITNEYGRACCRGKTYDGRELYRALLLRSWSQRIQLRRRHTVSSV
jgi:hypothetical protein